MSDEFDENETWQITEEGALKALEMHEQILQGWTLEQVAVYHGYDDVNYVKIILYLFYDALDKSDFSLDELTEEDLRLLTGD